MYSRVLITRIFYLSLGNSYSLIVNTIFIVISQLHDLKIKILSKTVVKCNNSQAYYLSYYPKSYKNNRFTIMSVQIRP